MPHHLRALDPWLAPLLLFSSFPMQIPPGGHRDPSLPRGGALELQLLMEDTLGTRLCDHSPWVLRPSLVRASDT